MLARLRSLLAAVLGRVRLEAELNEEIRFHCDAYAAELIDQGLSPDDAARRARIRFGPVATVKEACLDGTDPDRLAPERPRVRCEATR